MQPTFGAISWICPVSLAGNFQSLNSHRCQHLPSIFVRKSYHKCIGQKIKQIFSIARDFFIQHGTIGTHNVGLYRNCSMRWGCNDPKLVQFLTINVYYQGTWSCRFSFDFLWKLTVGPEFQTLIQNLISDLIRYTSSLADGADFEHLSEIDPNLTLWDTFW